MERSIDNKSRKEGMRYRYGRREREEGRNKRVGEGKEGRVLLYAILKYFLISLSATDCDVTL